MNKIDTEILNIDKVISANIDRFDTSERGLLSQNILSQLRNFVDYISLKAYSNGKNIDNSYDNIKDAEAYVKTRGELRFLSNFHKLLQKTISHYTPDEENSERLMLKYYECLLKIKSYLKNTHNLDVLKNINTFPINTDSVLKEYYEKIVEKVTQQKVDPKGVQSDRFYIQKVKPFFVNYEVYYEVTFTRANDITSKFDRIIAFTQLDISDNYAVKLSIISGSIKILDKNMPIQIINDWEISIRPCELNNFADIFGKHPKIQNGKEYKELMRFLTKTGLNLTEFIDLSDSYYQGVKTKIVSVAQTNYIFDVLDNVRTFVQTKKPGTNVIRYLLYRLNNKTIKQQYSYNGCDKFSDLKLEFGCIPFDEMPFNSSPLNHKPRVSDLFDCIDATDREHELFAKFITNKNEVDGQLYTPVSDTDGFKDVDALIQKYNSSLYFKHGHRRLEKFKDHIYIKGYEEDALYIIKKLKDLSSTGIRNYSSSIDSWLQTSTHIVDCDEKKDALRRLFEKSKVALVYGAAGTGKSTMINHIANFFNDKTKLYLANTNPAVDNLRRKVQASNCSYKTISKFLSPKNTDSEYDILIIDECSTVSNSNMREVLEKAKFKLLVLVGDVFQIESINFGNWFNIAQSFIPQTSRFELTKPYRSNNEKLITLWNKVRNIESDILEHITKNKYSVKLDESFFENAEENEIVLCLNYDGLYGINNINRFLQSNNKNSPMYWGIQTYKIGDPILFNEMNRFSPLIYNNLKGKIVGIKKMADKIQFDIEIDKVINELDAEDYDFELVENTLDGSGSIIRFSVNKYASTDEDDDDSSSAAMVPFQVSYAVSIHKAQGLEFDSVKVVITNEVEEMITHNIFYTAITRAKEKLKIYWTPETENKVLNGLEKKNTKKDIALLSLRLNQGSTQ
ncbi:MAG: ATP-dependent RecD-like DNA helicase [Massilibacteroides sp.]|nr:ATP-dependent RecD-like DNA helicase [Massilibacteroides sp.]MDD4406325.1 ATP-dependent RecD-like DNA helicase [Parabacteroides sp.]